MNAPTNIQPQSLASAMATAFAEIEGATKSANNPHFRTKYADLGAVIEAVKPALIKNGLFFTQRPQPSEGGITIETVLGHASGEELSLGSLFVPANKNDAQAYGSALTYARRYALVTAFGVPVEDDDGNGAVRGGQGQSQTGAVSPASPADYVFPEGPATGISQLKKMQANLWREIEGCGDESELGPLLAIPENKAIMKQLSQLEKPDHRALWYGDGADNPGLQGLIRRKRKLFDMQAISGGAYQEEPAQ